MCMKTYCDQCGLTTWKGCGEHIAQVLTDVPAEERCQCKKESTYTINQNEIDHLQYYNFENLNISFSHVDCFDFGFNQK